jgi:hypothetical protein
MLAVLLGCGPDFHGQDDLLSNNEELVMANGSNINGSNINGSNINGSNINGSNINGENLGSILVSVSLRKVRLRHFILDSVELRGSALVGFRAARAYGPQEMIGAVFTGTLGDGSTVKLELQGASLEGGSDIWRYAFSYRDGGEEWQPVCPGRATAVPVLGRWDYRRGVSGGGAKIADRDAFTLGCRGAAVDKCITAGYRPWAHRNGVSLEPFHQACVRMMRADFCGDGRSWTTNGRPINLYDGIGVQEDTEGWMVEAEWDADGARCVSPVNRSHLREVCGRAPDPACGNRARFQGGTLIVSETPHGPHVVP